MYFASLCVGHKFALSGHMLRLSLVVRVILFELRGGGCADSLIVNNPVGDLENSPAVCE